MRLGTRIQLGVAIGALATGALANTVLANPGDIGGAALTNLLQNAAYDAAPQSPNVTCDVTAGGRDVNQRTTYGIGEVYGQDAGFGQGECASLTEKRFNCTVEVWIEYYESSGPLAGTWQEIFDTHRWAYGTAKEGICTPSLPPVASKSYPGGSSYLNKYHQAHAVISNTIPGTDPRHDLSPVWFMVP